MQVTGASIGYGQPPAPFLGKRRREPEAEASPRANPVPSVSVGRSVPAGITLAERAMRLRSAVPRAAVVARYSEHAGDGDDAPTFPSP